MNLYNFVQSEQSDDDFLSLTESLILLSSKLMSFFFVVCMEEAVLDYSVAYSCSRRMRYLPMKISGQKE